MRPVMVSAALLCGGAVPALAQVAGPLPAAAVPAAPPAVDTDGDIIVTAQRQDEKLRDVPISITALDRDTLSKSGVTNTLEIARITPGLQLPVNGYLVQPSIRGVSSPGTGAGNSSNVAFYVDGVYQPTAAGQLLDLPDVEQVEVLKGPQGTFYGQNATGGAIIIHSIEPSFTATGNLSASYGNFDDKAFRGYVTGPLGETLAASVSGVYEDRDGFRRDILRGGRTNGLKSRLIRGRLLFRPTSSLSLTGTAYYSDRRDGDAFTAVPVGPGNPLGYALAGLLGRTIPKASGGHETALNVSSSAGLTTYGFSLLGRLDAGFGTFSTVTSFSKVKSEPFSDIDFTAADLAVADLEQDTRTFIQELNFVSERRGGLQVSAGAFYMNDKEGLNPQTTLLYPGLFDPAALTIYPDTPATPLVIGNRGFNLRHSYAAYLGLNYDITDRLNISVSGRYSYEEQVVSSTDNPALTPIRDLRGPFDFKKFTPGATVRYALTDRANVYASFSQGFKSGFVDYADAITYVGQPAKGSPVDPEVVTAYEVGFKGRLFDRLTLNVSAFHYDHKKLQVLVYVPGTPGFFQNAGAARMNGADIDASVAVTHDLSLSAGAAYTDAKYTRYPEAALYAPAASGFGYELVTIDAKGNRLPRTPRFTANGAVNYTTETSAGTFAGYVSAAYNSGITFSAGGLVRTGRFTTVNGELSFAPSALPGARLVLWAKNLTDKSYIAGDIEDPFALGATYAPPRTFGTRVEFRF